MQTLIFLVGLLASGSVAAHEVAPVNSPFVAHALHLFREPDHLALACAAGVLIGQGRPLKRSEGVFTFGMTLFLGMFTPQFLAPIPAFSRVENMLVAACLLAAGVLLLIAAQLGKWSLSIIGAIAGIVHGLSSGWAVTAGTFWYPAFLGAILGSLVVNCVGLWVGDRARRRSSLVILPRAFGTVVIVLAAMRLTGSVLP